MTTLKDEMAKHAGNLSPKEFSTIGVLLGLASENHQFRATVYAFFSDKIIWERGPIIWETREQKMIAWLTANAPSEDRAARYAKLQKLQNVVNDVKTLCENEISAKSAVEIFQAAEVLKVMAEELLS